MSAIQNGNIIQIDNCENCSWTCYVSDNASFKLNKYCGFGDGEISIIPTFNSDIIYGIVTFVFNRRPCQIVQELEITQNKALMPSFFSVTPKDIFFTNKNEEINVSVKTNMGTPIFENHNASDYSVAQIDSDGDNYIFTVNLTLAE